MSDNKNSDSLSPMLNAYPDSLGKNLSEAVEILDNPGLKGAFGSFYILPSLYNTDLDRGFSVIDYNLGDLADKGDLESLRKMGLDLKLDFILNHASVLSPQFRDLLKNGQASKYADFFINWNKFWDGCGKLNEEGYIEPDKEYIKNMFFRKPGLPLLMVDMPDGKKIPYWNTFYRETLSEDAPHKELMEKEGVPYLGQMDLNINSPLVWDFYEETLKKLASYGAKIVRLDAFAYAPKSPGKKNFLNEPDTWDLLEKVSKIAKKYDLNLLPEIHASYSEGIYKKISDKGYMTYDFFLPGLLIYAIEKKDPTKLAIWASELIDNNIKTVNMLGCHDGIPVLDLKGLIADDEIKELIDLLVKRGGHVKDLHGAKNIYYQVNATYYSALGEDDKKFLFARAVQLFMPGKPQIWYLDLFAGKNDYEAVKRAGKDGHKEINRTNLSKESILEALKKPVVQKQLELIKLRNQSTAFGNDSIVNVSIQGKKLIISRTNLDSSIKLTADFEDYSYTIE